MKTFKVTGMSCAACSSKVEKAALSVDGVTSATVNLLTGALTVNGNFETENIITAVKITGYGITEGVPDYQNKCKDKYFTNNLMKLILSLVLLFVLMYFSMGVLMWNFPAPEIILKYPVLIGYFEMIISIFIMIINSHYFFDGIKSLFHFSPNMNTLISMGSIVSFVWSVFSLINISCLNNSSCSLVFDECRHLYFESSAMILSFINIGKTLEARAKGKTTDALSGLLSLSPNNATIIKDGNKISVKTAEINSGDIVSVLPGESFPVDGTVINGETSVNQSSITGESIPVDKSFGDAVFAGTINLSGYVEYTATSTSESSVLSSIVRSVSDAASTKAPLSRIADKVSAVFVPVVLFLSVITFITHYLLSDIGTAVQFAVSVLVISCPCALGLATPVAITVGSGIGAKNGILYKSAEALEIAGKTEIIAFDKTGTLTTGKMSVTDLIPYGNYSDTVFLQIAASAESKSEHPIAKAILNYAISENIKLLETSKFFVTAGNGITVEINEKTIYAGKPDYVFTKCKVIDYDMTIINKLEYEGKTVVLFSNDKDIIGLIALADTLRDNSIKTIKLLSDNKKHIVMLSGDNEKAAGVFAERLGISEYYAGLMPDDKTNYINNLKQNGSVIMIGDGINDAPALTSADIGIAVANGTDIAIDSADIVLMNQSPLTVYDAISLSKNVIKNIKQNLFWALFYNLICIPVAAGALLPIGISVTPGLCAAAMSLSSFCVVSNALRLNKFKFSKGEDTMIKELKIKGMMCPHCEAAVKKAVEAVPGVICAETSYKKNKAVVNCDNYVDMSAVIDAITDAGYEVIKVKE